jgi:hypothetical protein
MESSDFGVDVAEPQRPRVPPLDRYERELLIGRIPPGRTREVPPAGLDVTELS